MSTVASRQVLLFGFLIMEGRQSKIVDMLPHMRCNRGNWIADTTPVLRADVQEAAQDRRLDGCFPKDVDVHFCPGAGLAEAIYGPWSKVRQAWSSAHVLHFAMDTSNSKLRIQWAAALPHVLRCRLPSCNSLLMRPGSDAAVLEWFMLQGPCSALSNHLWTYHFLG